MIDLSHDKTRYFISGILSFLIFVILMGFIGALFDSKEVKNANNRPESKIAASEKINSKVSTGENNNKSESSKNIIDNEPKYVVKKGDYLYKIAIETGVSVQDLKKINNLKNNNLSIGQVLLLK